MSSVVRPYEDTEAIVKFNFFERYLSMWVPVYQIKLIDLKTKHLVLNNLWIIAFVQVSVFWI